MEIKGQKVLHSTYGEGVITWYGGDPANNNKYILVACAEKELKLPFPSAFKKHLVAIDKAFAEHVQNEINLQAVTVDTDTNQRTATISCFKKNKQNHNPLTYCSKNTFTFVREEAGNKERNRYGFIIYDNENRFVAVAAMHTDKRGVAYGQAELCFFDRYASEFGQWRLVSIGKQRLSYARLTSILNEKGSFTATLDPRKGS